MILAEVLRRDPWPCVDYRKLNYLTKDPTYFLPNIEVRVKTTSAARYIPTLDLRRCYWQVLLTERASRYTAFCPPFGTFRLKMMSFGLKTALLAFSRLMDEVLRGLSDFHLPYLGAAAVFSLRFLDLPLKNTT